MDESSKVLSAMNQYPITHLRIHFPDEHVIQVSFKPTDTVEDVKNFLRPFLACPTTEFSLCECVDIIVFVVAAAGILSLLLLLVHYLG